MADEKTTEIEHTPKFQRDKQAKKKKIIDTFLDLVDEIGYNTITTNKIAEKANLSIGTIYRYFKNKEDILNQTFDRNIEEFNPDEKEFVKILTERDVGATRIFVRHYLDSHKKRYQKAYDQARAASTDIFRQYEENMAKMVGLFVDREISGKMISKNHREIAMRTLTLAITLVETYTHRYLFQTPNMFLSEEEFVHYVAGLFLFTLDFYLPKN
ncbi:MAG: TetR/AcrR family transcriptional regulator [Promethearchaeota archaeon]